MTVTRVIKYHILMAVVVQKYNRDGNYGDVIDHNDGDVINHNSGWLSGERETGVLFRDCLS